MKKDFTELLNLADILASNVDINYKKNFSTNIFPILKKFPKYLCNHPGHIYSDVFDHTMASIEFFKDYINNFDEFSNLEKKIMFIVLLLHDTGKMKTWSVDEKGITYYKNHPKQSAIIAKELLDEYDIDENTKMMIINLVEMHDTYVDYSNDSGIKDIIKRIGLKETGMLLKIQRADMSSHAKYYKDDYYHRLDKITELYESILKN